MGSAVSEPLLRAHRFCDGLAGVAKSLCFLRASVGDVRHLGSAVSEPLLRAHRFCDGLAGVAKSLCFLRASVGNVRHFGFGRFGTAPQSSGSAMGWLV